MSALEAPVKETLELTIVDQKVQTAYDHFMHVLQEDIHKHLGFDEKGLVIPFIVKTNFELGTHEQHAVKLFQYRKVLQAMLDRSHKTKRFDQK